MVNFSQNQAEANESEGLQSLLLLKRIEGLEDQVTQNQQLIHQLLERCNQLERRLDEKEAKSGGTPMMDGEEELALVDRYPHPGLTSDSEEADDVHRSKESSSKYFCKLCPVSSSTRRDFSDAQGLATQYTSKHGVKTEPEDTPPSPAPEFWYDTDTPPLADDQDGTNTKMEPPVCCAAGTIRINCSSELLQVAFQKAHVAITNRVRAAIGNRRLACNWICADHLPRFASRLGLYSNLQKGRGCIDLLQNHTKHIKAGLEQIKESDLNLISRVKGVKVLAAEGMWWCVTCRKRARGRVTDFGC